MTGRDSSTVSPIPVVVVAAGAATADDDEVASVAVVRVLATPANGL